MLLESKSSDYSTHMNEVTVLFYIIANWQNNWSASGSCAGAVWTAAD